MHFYLIPFVFRLSWIRFFIFVSIRDRSISQCTITKKTVKKKASGNMTSTKFIVTTSDVKTKLLKFMVQSKSLYYFPSDATSPSFVFALCLALWCHNLSSQRPLPTIVPFKTLSKGRNLCSSLYFADAE